MATEQLTAQRLQLPWKLHVILEDPQYESIVAWGSNGETFRILSKDDFSEVITPKFFTSNCYKSFQRSLNLWGFRATKSEHAREYMHPLFKKGQPELCNSMQRIKHRGGPSRSRKSIKTRSSSETKPPTTTSTVSLSAPSVISEDSILSARDEDLFSRVAAGGCPISSLLHRRPPHFFGRSFGSSLSTNNYHLLPDSSRLVIGTTTVPAAAPVLPMSHFVLPALADVLVAHRHERIFQKATYQHQNQHLASFL